MILVNAFTVVAPMDQVYDALNDGNLRRSPYHGQVFTDDLAPVERLIDQIILGFVTGRGSGP